MSNVTVKQFAEVVGVPPNRLLVQLGEAGLEISDENATISDKEKTQLLDFLRQSHGKRGALSAGGASKVTLKRKTQSELRATVPAGRGPAARGAVRARPETKTVTGRGPQEAYLCKACGFDGRRAGAHQQGAGGAASQARS